MFAPRSKTGSLIYEIILTTAIFGVLIVAGLLVGAPWWLFGTAIGFVLILAALHYGLPPICRRVKILWDQITKQDNDEDGQIKPFGVHRGI